MRHGTLFEENKEQVSVFFYDSILTNANVYIVENVYAVFHPIAGGLVYNAGILSQTQADSDFRVILEEANSEIEETHTLVRYRGETNEQEYTITDVLEFGGSQHLFVKEEGI